MSVPNFFLAVDECQRQNLICKTSRGHSMRFEGNETV